jgi:hypothetical protein
MLTPDICRHNPKQNPNQTSAFPEVFLFPQNSLFPIIFPIKFFGAIPKNFAMPYPTQKFSGPRYPLQSFCFSPAVPHAKKQKGFPLLSLVRDSAYSQKHPEQWKTTLLFAGFPHSAAKNHAKRNFHPTKKNLYL